MGNIFGPVPSRRLGLSLGVDLVPSKVCNQNCLYCECGPTTNLICEPTELIPAADILAELKEVLANERDRIDYVTMSGYGEPTLNRDLPEVIKGVRELTDARVALITNSTLLHLPEVTGALSGVDLLLPSLDTVFEETYRKFNRPHPQTKLADLLTGLERLRDSYAGLVWLEMLLSPGYNDSPAELEGLARWVEKIEPDKIQLNTVDRPPIDQNLKAVDYDRLTELARWFGPKAEVIVRPPSNFKPGAGRPLIEAILELIDRRPCTMSDIVAAVGREETEIEAILSRLDQQGRVIRESAGPKTFWRGKPPKGA